MKILKATLRRMSSLLRLGKAEISLLAALSAATGSLLAGPSFLLTQGLAALTLGTFLLAMGASALNQLQDREIDARMGRTCRRPLPAGELRPVLALGAALVLLSIGLILLAAGASPAAAGVGALAVLWYNGVYAYLKRRTGFAAVPGALVGAAPPAMGWLAAGGQVSDPRLLGLCAFFFLWQVPHFWLLLLEYRQEYRAASIASAARVFTPARLSRIVFVWSCAAGAAALGLPFYGVLTYRSTALLLVAATLAFLLEAARALLGRRLGARFGRAFQGTNAYMVAVMALVVLDKYLCSACGHGTLWGLVR